MDQALPTRRLLPLHVSTSAQPASVAVAGTADGVRTLIDAFLAEQATTSAVDRFATAHDALDVDAEPVQARWYRDLMPAAGPGPGQQWAFEVDLDACSGCKACVTACHSMNGLDGDTAFREVGLLVGTGEHALLQPVTTGCHHCAEPGCLDGCPVDAYVKLEDGVVQHLDDQCIGCSYCTLTCPYEVPQYDAARGIVRKCDLCHDRLAEGEAPACVQGCPTQAIRITVVDVEQAGREDWGFTAPSPDATRPTTRFVSTRDLRTGVAPADRHTVAPRHAHPPLVVMLVLTQLAVGSFVAGELLRRVGLVDTVATTAAAPVAAAALVVTVVALIASLAHLGRPQYAWRAVIGLRHSWLSREIVTFGVFAPAGIAHAAVLAGVVPGLDVETAAAVADLTGTVAATIGLLAVATSVMVYVATRREGWSVGVVGLRFGLTTVTLGTLATGLMSRAVDATPGAVDVLLTLAAGGVVAALVVDLAERRRPDPDTTAGRRARILRGPLAELVQLRVALGVLSAAALLVGRTLAGAGRPGGAMALVAVALLAATGAEACARWWFFAAEGSPRMPGGRA